MWWNGIKRGRHTVVIEVKEDG